MCRPRHLAPDGRRDYAGERFAFVDMLIGVLAADSGALVWSLDSDFERMERLGLVSRYDPSAAPML